MENTQPLWRGSLQLVIGLTLAVLFFYMMAPFMVAILLGAVTAAISHPIYDSWRRRVPRPVAAGGVVVVIGVGILAPIVFVVYLSAYRIMELVTKMRFFREENSVQNLVNHPAVAKFFDLITRYLPVDQDWIHAQSLTILGEVLEKLSSIAAAAIRGTPGLLLAFGIVVLSLYFFLIDGPRFLRFMTGVMPLQRARAAALYETFEGTCRAVVLGLLMSAGIQGVLMALAFAICGLPNVILIGFATVLCGMIPLVGTAPVWIAAAVYLGFQHAIGKMVFMILMGVLIGASDNLVRLWVMKGGSSLHPLLALVSVFGAINLVGPMGIFLGPIIAAVFVSFLKIMAMDSTREPVV